MTPPEPVSTLLRASVLVTACCGVAALALTGLLSTPVAALAGILLCAAAWAPTAYSAPEGRAARRVVAGTVMVAAAVLALVSGDVTGTLVDVGTALAELGQLIAPAMTGVLIAQLLVADRPRDLTVALILGCMTFLLGIGMASRPAVVLPLLVAWPAVVTALHEIHAVRRRGLADVIASADHDEAPARRPNGSTVLLAAVSAAVAVLAVFLVPASDGVAARSRLGGPNGQAIGNTASRSVEAYSSGVLDLRARGELPTTPVAEVPADSPTLWRGVVLSFYDGSTWRAASRTGAGADEPTGPAGATPLLRRDRVTIREGFAGVLLSPGRPLGVDVRGEVLPLDGGLAIHPPAEGRYPSTYTVTTAVTDPPARVLRAAAGTDPTTIDVVGVPPRLPARVHQLGQRLTAGAGTRYDAVLAVERFLRGHATYRLDSPVPARGHDAVDHFLFEARTGFCEQFASAEAVLLRAAGIPARLVTGFSGGTVTGEDRLLRSGEAHAWVEVWYPGVGWVASDPTAGAQLADGSRSLTARLDALLRAIEERLGVPQVLGVAALALIVAAGLSVARRRSGRGASRRMDDARPRSPVVAAFRRLEAALEGAGRPRRPAESLSELAQRLPGDHAVTEALSVLEQVCYGPRAPGVRAVHEATRAIDDLAARVIAEQPR